MGRDHEDLVLATGRLENGVSFNCVVDWLSPTKVRQTRVLGERGMLVADTLTADLTLLRERRRGVASGATTQSLRGVTEGDATRYALARREPLLVELEAFCDLRRAATPTRPWSRSPRASRPSLVRRGRARQRAPAAQTVRRSSVAT